MLTTLLIIPLIGALIVGFFPGNLEAKKLRQITEVFAVITLFWSLYLLSRFDLSNPQFQFQEYFPGFPN